MGNFAQLITKVFLPCMIFYMMVTSVTVQLLVDNMWLVLACAVAYIALALAAFVAAKAMCLPHDKDRVFQFAFIFGNTGFVGFPLLTAVFPGTGILFMCLLTIIDQPVFWTYGIWLSTARGRKAAAFNPRILLSPNIIAILIALVWVTAGLPLPGVLDTVLGSVAHATSPLCMMYLGAMICFTPLGDTLKRPELYVYIVVKMVLLAIAAGLASKALGMAPDVAGCIALFVALPVMTVVPMIASQNGDEGPYATGIAVASFVACIATIPLVAFVVL